MIRFETGAERFWIGVPSKQPHEEVGHYRDALIELRRTDFPFKNRVLYLSQIATAQGEHFADPFLADIIN